jgi:hypothetical protein
MGNKNADAWAVVVNTITYCKKSGGKIANAATRKPKPPVVE